MEDQKALFLSYKKVLNLISSIYIDKSRNDAYSEDVFLFFNSSSSCNILEVLSKLGVILNDTKIVVKREPRQNILALGLEL